MNHNQLALAATATAAVIGTVTIVGWLNKKRNGKKLPPMAQGIGLRDTIRYISSGKFHELTIDQYHKVGPIYRLPLPLTTIVIANGHDARTVVHSPGLIKPATLAFDSFASGNNLLTSNGIQWSRRRKSVAPSFTRKHVRRMSEIVVEKTNVWLNESLQKIAGPPGQPGNPSFNVSAETLDLTMGILCKAAFDYDISHEEIVTITDATNTAMTEFGFKTMTNPLRRLFTWALSERREAFAQAGVLRQFAQKMTALYRQNPSPTSGTILDHIMKNDYYRNDDERLPDIVIWILGGHETTGYALANLLAELAKHPKVQTKLRNELAKDPSSPYLDAVIQETFRLRPSIPVTLLYQLGSDVTSKDGYFMPKGSYIFGAHNASAQDPSLFDNASQFEPSRWLQADTNQKHAMYPFSLGKRYCPGQPFAMSELRTVVPLLVKRFDLWIESAGFVETKATASLNDCYLKVSALSNT